MDDVEVLLPARRRQRVDRAWVWMKLQLWEGIWGNVYQSLLPVGRWLRMDGRWELRHALWLRRAIGIGKTVKVVKRSDIHVA